MGRVGSGGGGTRRRPGSYVTVFPGRTYRVSAVDVDGERLVVLAAHGPEATATERAELTNMVETLRFVDAPTS